MKSFEFVAERSAAAGFTVALLAGCSGAGGYGTPGVTASSATQAVAGARAKADMRPIVRPLERPPRRRQSQGWMSPAVVKPGSHVIYSGSFDQDVITIFPSIGKNPPPIGQITSGLNEPERLFVDRNLKLYASNAGSNTVTVYNPGKTTPSRTISNGIDTPTGLTVGADATVYVANVGNDTVTVYPKKQNSPSLTILMPNYELPENLAIDAKNNLYVAYLGGAHGSGVMEFAPGQSTGQDLNLQSGDVTGVTVDSKGDVIVLDGYPAEAEIFPPGKTTASKKIAITDGSPFELAMSKDEKTLYASVEVGLVFYIEAAAFPDGKAFKDRITSNVQEWPLATGPDNVQ